MSNLEETLELHIRAHKLLEPHREYRFDLTRRWRFDFAWPTQKLAVEVEGGVWSGGRHTTGQGFEADAEKYNAAVLQGWRVLRFTANTIKSGMAVATIAKALDMTGAWEMAA